MGDCDGGDDESATGGRYLSGGTKCRMNGMEVRLMLTCRPPVHLTPLMGLVAPYGVWRWDGRSGRSQWLVKERYV